MKLHII